LSHFLALQGRLSLSGYVYPSKVGG